MEEIVDKYTGQTFRSRQEYDAFGRTEEYHNAQEEYYKRRKGEYECYFCKAIFSTLDELKRHHEEHHLDVLIHLQGPGGI